MIRWKHKLDVSDLFHDDDLTLEQKRDGIVARLQAQTWAMDDYEYEMLVDELSEVDNEEYFNQVWANLYDWADTDHQLWLNVWPSLAPSR